MEICTDANDNNRVKPLDEECKNNQSTIEPKRLAKGCTSLMYACQQGHTGTIVKELRTKPKTIYQRDKSKKSALHYCSVQKDLVAAASVAVAAPELLESADEDGFTPLHLAVIQGNMALVNLLLANKADVNALDNEGHSVVHWATVCGEIEALRTVLAAGANVSIPDKNGGSPLHYAAQMCGSTYEGKSGHASTALALEILQICLLHPLSEVNSTDKDGRQPLLWAASAGSAKAVLALVNAGARVDSSDKDGLTALHCAASRGHTECIDTLISLCGAPTDLIDSNGCTALHYAVTLGHADATSILLDLEADPNRQDRKGRTPAHCGCAKGQFETVKILRERRANMWLRNAKGDLPIHEAGASGRRELVQWLLDQKPKQVNVTSNDGRTILHIAAGSDNTEMCKMLLDYGADINCIYRTNRNIVMTPLDCALQKGYRSTAKFLQLHGGLPASKLRLSGRKPNALTDQELVTPLNFKQETLSMPTSGTNATVAQNDDDANSKDVKRFVVYINHSESDDNSCDENVPRKGQHKSRSTCHHHRHRYRMRTSSCETYAVHKDDDSCNDMCRSKSNIEIHRRRKSRHKRDSSSYSDDSSSDECCRHRKRNRHRHKRSTRKSKSKDPQDSSDCDGSCKRKQKRDKRSVSAAKDNADNLDTKSGNADKNNLKVEETINKAQNEAGPIEADKKVDEVRTKSGTLKRPQSARASSAKQRAAQKLEVDKAGDTESKMEVISETTNTEKAEVDKSSSDDHKNIALLNNNDSESAEAVEITTKADVHVSNDVAECTVKQVQSKEIESTLLEESTNVEQREIDETHVATASVTETNQAVQNLESAALQSLTSNAAENVDNQQQDPPKSLEVLPDSDPQNSALHSENTDEAQHNIPEQEPRKSSFTVLASDESVDQTDPFSGTEQERPKSFKVLSSLEKDEDVDDEDEEYYSSDDDDVGDHAQQMLHNQNDQRHRMTSESKKAYKQSKQYSVDIPNRILDKTLQQHSKDQDSGFEPSPRAMRTKIPTPQSAYAAAMPRKRTANGTVGGSRQEQVTSSGSGRQEGRKPGDKSAVNMVTVSQSIQKNIRRYYMERKIFQHLLELKSLQIRSSKINESVLVKRAVDDYHKSTLALGLETGGSLRRYPYKDYTFKNFEIFLYETLKSLQKTGTYNFQNISDVYKEAERRLSPDYKRYEKALHCTTKTHRCLHAAHAYTGIPCAAYIPMMNHHTMPKYGFGPLKTAGVGSFYLPKILTRNAKSGNKVSLELSHGNNKQLISLPSEKLDYNKRYYVTFTVKGNENVEGTAGSTNHNIQLSSSSSPAQSTTTTAAAAAAAATSTLIQQQQK